MSREYHVSYDTINAYIAQLVERQVAVLLVPGSIPGVS